MKIIISLAVTIVVSLLLYSCIGTGTRVDEIKRRTPIEIPTRNWKILRYEGYQYGSWNYHGGKVWYHVANVDDPSVQYRVFITLWGGELQYTYGNPEPLHRIEIKNSSLEK